MPSENVVLMHVVLSNKRALHIEILRKDTLQIKTYLTKESYILKS